MYLMMNVSVHILRLKITRDPIIHINRLIRREMVANLFCLQQ
jgi:hypothetical protein